jgi:hypothetical protein
MVLALASLRARFGAINLRGDELLLGAEWFFMVSLAHFFIFFWPSAGASMVFRYSLARS